MKLKYAVACQRWGLLPLARAALQAKTTTTTQGLSRDQVLWLAHLRFVGSQSAGDVWPALNRAYRLWQGPLSWSRFVRAWELRECDMV